MESVMRFLRTDIASNSRLRFVFDEAVVSFDLAANSTLEDVARTLGELESLRYGKPITIDVTLTALPAPFGSLHAVS
jgi:hypothetical protein